MPASVSADPVGLLRFAGVSTSFAERLTAESRAIASALDRVAARSGDRLPSLPRPDRDLERLSSLARSRATGIAAVAARFLLADEAFLLPVLGPPAHRWLPLLRAPLDLTGDELESIARRLVGDGSWARQTSTLVTFLTPADGFTEILTGTSARERLGSALRELPFLGPLLGTAPVQAVEPWLRGAGRGLGALAMVDDVRALVDDGSPAGAFERAGARYVASWARLGFDVSATACSEVPSWATCGAAVVTGAALVATEGYVHREELGQAVATTVDGASLAAGALRDWVGGQLEAIDQAADGAIDSAADAADRARRDLERRPSLVRLPPAVLAGAEAVVAGARTTAHAGAALAGGTGARIARGAASVIDEGADALGDALRTGSR